MTDGAETPPPAPDPARRTPASVPVADLATARLWWQVGDWAALAALEVDIAASATSPRDLELALYKVEAAFQTGRGALGRDLLDALVATGIDRRRLLPCLLGGTWSSLARARLLLDAEDEARRSARAAVAARVSAGDVALVAEMRLAHERQALAGQAWPPRRRHRCLFVDCGGHDGCSALMFLLTHPHYDCVTFEPNPALWRYYEGLPIRLIRKAVYTYDGEISFTIDPVDGDGSTLVKGKRIDFTGSVADDAAPVITVPCIDLSAFVRKAARRYDRIVLKLDVEGAEYDILERMLADGTIAYVDRLYCEFHGHKMPIDLNRRAAVQAQVRARVPTDPWDAHHSFFRVAPRDEEGNRAQRKEIVSSIRRNRAKFTRYAVDR
jgi:FkbM family methyltransferase